MEVNFENIIVERETDIGIFTLSVTEEHVSNFPLLIEWINKKGLDSCGVVKLRLPVTSKILPGCQSILDSVAKFKRQAKPEIQNFFSFGTEANCYTLENTKVGTRQKQSFKNLDLTLEKFSSENCCSQHLQNGGLQKLLDHFWHTIKLHSHPQRKNNKRVVQDPNSAAIMYGAGLKANHITVGQAFSLSHLQTILNEIEQSGFGINTPMVYIGTKHSVTAWHLEDYCLQSINYLVFGAPKIWFTVPPQYCFSFDLLLRLLEMPSAYLRCRNHLSHKEFVLSPEFLRSNNIPVIEFIQREGEYVIVSPSVPHFVFNTGHNCAQSVNFGTKEWIPYGVLASKCCCENTIQIDMRKILERHRPDLLSGYKLPSDYYPPVKYQAKRSRKILFCPKCPKQYTGGLARKHRLIDHVYKEHSDELEFLMSKLNEVYPNPEVRTNIGGFVCKICTKFLKGNSFNLKKHMKSMHSNNQEKTGYQAGNATTIFVDKTQDSSKFLPASKLFVHPKKRWQLNSCTATS